MTGGISVETIREAAGRVRGQYALTGTAALWMRGWDVQPADLDFLVEEPQAPLGTETAPGSTPGSYRTEIDGVKVDYIFADPERRPFMRPASWVDGVRVVEVEAALAIKARAARDKDVRFILDWHLGKVGRR